MENFMTMTRKQLQALCKKHGVPANLKNADMAARLSSLILLDDEAQGKEQLGSGRGSGDSENVKVEFKKKVRFHPENDVHEFVDTYMEAAEKEQAEARRERASRRRGLRKNGLTKADKVNAVETEICESEEISSNQVRLTRSRKQAVIVSPPPCKRAKTGAKAASDTGEKESFSNSDVVVDSVLTNASMVKEFDKKFVAGKGETVGRRSRLAEVNSLRSEPMVETKSAADVPRRTRSQRKFKGDDTSILGSDDTTKPVTEHDLLTGHRDSSHEEPPPRKSSRGVMKNISNMPEKQKRGSAGILEKQEKKRPKNEFSIVTPDIDESITLATEEEENTSQLKEDNITSKSSTSTSTTVDGLELDSSEENQRTCGSFEVKLPMVEPLRRSRRKKIGYDGLGSSDVNSLPGDSNHINPTLNQTRMNETEYCHEAEAITTNDTRNCSKSDLVVEAGCLSKKLDSEEKYNKRTKRSARFEKGVCKSIEIPLGENVLLKKIDVSELKYVNLDGLVSITEVVKDGISSAKTMAPFGSEVHDEFVEACVLTGAAPLVEESTICTVEEASISDLAKSLSIPEVGESQITACGSPVVQRQTLTDDPVQLCVEFEEPAKPSEFSTPFSYDMPHAGCTGDEVSTEVGEKYSQFDDKHNYNNSLSSKTRVSKGAPTEGVSDHDATSLEEYVIVLYNSPKEGKDAHGIINDLPITREVVPEEDTCEKICSSMLVKQNVVDGESKETSSGDAAQSTEASLTFQNVESMLCRKSNKDKTTEEQDIIDTDELHPSSYMPGSEVGKNLHCDLNIDEMASDDHSLVNKQGQSSCFCNPYDAEGKSDGNWEQNLEFVRSTPGHGHKLSHDKSKTERVSSDQADSCNLDGRPNIFEQLDAEEEVTVSQFSEPLKQLRSIKVDLTVDVTRRMDDRKSKPEVLATEAGSVSFEKDSLSVSVATDENATNHQTAEPSQELDKETNNSLLYFNRVDKISGDACMKLAAAKNEFAQDGHDAYINEACTTLHVTKSEVDHLGNVASDDASLVSSDSSLSFHESQAERNAETTDAVDYATLAHSPLSVEDFIVDKGTQNPNAFGHLNGVSLELIKEFTSEYMGRNGVSLYYSKTTQSEEIIASCSQKSPSGKLPILSTEFEEYSYTDTLSRPPCPENSLVDQAIVSIEEPMDECDTDEYLIGKREATLNSSIGSRGKQSITEVKNEVEVDNTFPELGDRLTYYALGDLDYDEESSMDFVNCHDAELLVTRTNSEAVCNLEKKARTESGDLKSDDLVASCLKKNSGSKEIIISTDILVPYDDAEMARGSASCSEYPSFDKLDGLLQEIDDYFEWRNSEEKAVEESAVSDDIKEKVLNSNVETYFEVAIKTNYGGYVHMNECKCIAGVDVEVYAAPWEGHGERNAEIADNEHADEFVIKDDQVDHHEDILEERCSEEHGLSGYESGRASVKSSDVLQTSPCQSVICTGLKLICSAEKKLEIDSHQSVAAFQDGSPCMPILPREATTGLLSNTGVNALALEKDVHLSDDPNAIVDSVKDENICEGIIGVLNPQILSSSNCEAEMFEQSHGLAAQDILWMAQCENNSQEPTSLGTDMVLDAGMTRQQITKVMKENVTPVSKTETMKLPKSVSNRRRKALDSLRNN